MRVNADETREVADVVLELNRRIPGPHRPRRARVTHDASSADERARTDDELELAIFLAARSASQDRVLADDASLAQPDVRRDDRGRVHRRLEAGAHARTGSSRYATRAPPDRSDRMASSRTRTTVRPASPSLRGFLPSRTHSMKWRISTCSASVIGMRGLWMSPAR